MVAAVLYLLGVNIAHVFGIVTFALHFVPNLGPLIATFLPMPLVIFDPGEYAWVKSMRVESAFTASW